MIKANKSIVEFKGTSKELTFEFTNIILSFKTTLMNEFELSEDEVFQIIKLCGELAFMTTEERQQYLESLIDEPDNEK